MALIAMRSIARSILRERPPARPRARSAISWRSNAAKIPKTSLPFAVHTYITGMHQPPAGIRAHRAKGVDAAVLLADLKVEREAAGPEGFAFRGFRRGCLGSRLRRGVGCAPVVRWWDAAARILWVLDLRVSQSGAPGVRYRPKRWMIAKRTMPSLFSILYGQGLRGFPGPQRPSPERFT